jgi:hypothetical protein
MDLDFKKFLDKFCSFELFIKLCFKINSFDALWIQILKSFWISFAVLSYL